MNTNDILNLDCRVKENKEIIQKVLKKIKPLEKYSEEIKIEVLENLLKKICIKYSFEIEYIIPRMHDNESKIIWEIKIKNEGTSKQIFGISLYECISKSIIYTYSKVRKK